MDKIVSFVPAYNEQEYIPVVLESLLRLKREGIMDGVLVVDSNSTDRTAEVASDMGAQVVKQTVGNGKGGAFLEGVRSCLEMGAKIILMFDADIIVPLRRDQVEAMIRPLQKDGRIEMVIYPPIEGERGGEYSLAESEEFSGQRAFRASTLKFLFEKKAGENGKLVFSNSPAARRFRGITDEYALETGLNHWYDRIGRGNNLTTAVDADLRDDLIHLAAKERRPDLLQGQVEQIRNVGLAIYDLMKDKGHRAFLVRQKRIALARQVESKTKNIGNAILRSLT